MPGKVRVSALARELGVTTKDVLANLSELGEYVKSASSPLEAPVERRVREAFGSPSGSHRADVRQTAPRMYPKNPFGLGVSPTTEGYPRDIPRPERPSPLPHGMRPRRHRREWHRGTQPSGFTKFLIDELVIIRRSEDAPVPPSQYRYWADEVTEGEKIAAKWSGCLLDGLRYSDVLAWIRVFKPESIWGYLRAEPADPANLAVELQLAGVHPADLGWSWEDKGRGTLANRLLSGAWTVEMVVAEVEGRRASTAS